MLSSHQLRLDIFDSIKYVPKHVWHNMFLTAMKSAIICGKTGVDSIFLRAYSSFNYHSL